MPEANEALPGGNEKIPVPVRRYVNLYPLELRFPDGMESALFGLRCFGSAERKFREIRGAYSTSMDYPRGYTPNPTNQEMCSAPTGQNEVVRAIFPASDCFLRSACCSRRSRDSMIRGRVYGRATIWVVNADPG